MGMERVTVEQNGERFTLEVPEGTSDDEITKFLNQQQQTESEITKAPASPSENLAGQAAIAAAPAATDLGFAGTKAVLNAPITNFTNPLTHPITTARNVAGAIEKLVPQVPIQEALPAGSLVQSVPSTRAMNVGEALMAGGRGVGQALVAPESSFLMPYNMAAYEQAKIRENPNKPGLEYNPYAQTIRGEAKTQGRAGEANRMRATANMPFGNVTPQERQMLEEDMKIKSVVRKKALEKVLGPVMPGSF